jgi:urease accessory protein
MLTVNKLIPQGKGLAPALTRRAATVQLSWDVRQKSRFDAVDSAGRVIGVFLPRGSVVRGGDVLVAEDGSLIAVLAAPQPVLVVRHCSEHGSPFDLMRAAYHLGNRHVPLALQPDRLVLEPDHVLADMLRAMHLIVSSENAAFEPEAGAYAAGGHAHGPHDHDSVHAIDPTHEQNHAHDHGHGPEHSHNHPPSQGHAHGHAASPVSVPARGKPLGVAVKAEPGPHVHGPGCGHDHGDHHH